MRPRQALCRLSRAIFHCFESSSAQNALSEGTAGTFFMPPMKNWTFDVLNMDFKRDERRSIGAIPAKPQIGSDRHSPGGAETLWPTLLVVRGRSRNRRVLEELRLGATETLIEARLELGEYSEVVASCEATVVEHPLQEGLWGRLMLALYMSGRQADALRGINGFGPSSAKNSESNHQRG